MDDAGDKAGVPIVHRQELYDFFHDNAGFFGVENGGQRADGGKDDFKSKRRKRGNQLAFGEAGEEKTGRNQHTAVKRKQV